MATIRNPWWAIGTKKGSIQSNLLEKSNKKKYIYLNNRLEKKIKESLVSMALGFKGHCRESKGEESGRRQGELFWMMGW